MKDLILAIDQGTTGSTILLLNSSLKIVAKESVEILPDYPQAGWVELDLHKMWQHTCKLIESTLKNANISSDQIACIGITNQRETTCAWNKKSGDILHQAIVWQCRRTQQFCENLKNKGLEPDIQKRSGLVLDPYFSASKMRWLLDNVDPIANCFNQKDLAFGTIDSFLVYQLTAKQAHITDVSNASRTSLMNLETLDWDNSLCEYFDIEKSCLPKICSSSEIYGHTKDLKFLADGIPICSVLGDQQAALLGQMCIEAGDAKITYGTGCFLLTNTGSKIISSKNNLLTTVAWKIKNDCAYALEGSAFMGGATVQWLRDGLKIIKSAAETENLAKTARDEDMGDLVFVPAMTGLGAPHWDANARGIIAGITRGTNAAHLARAALEGIAHQNDELLTAMAQDFGQNLQSIKVDGGAAANNYLMQLQCDLAQLSLSRPKAIETTAIGAAIAAGLAVDIWPDFTVVKEVWELDRNFQPEMDNLKRDKMKSHWQKAIQRCRL